ncbi:MAG: glycosyltransferase [Bacteroidetes bacterium]|nr:MAG: glycosyltransferase [Bacteroidota bacterium]
MDFRQMNVHQPSNNTQTEPSAHAYRPRVLLLADWFAPGYKAGGPIRSCVNFCRQLQPHFDIWVLTTDTDLNEAQPYPHIRSNEWTHFDGHTRVWYFSKDQLSYRALAARVQEVQPDFVYLNSMYSLPFTIWPLYMKWRGELAAKVVLTPRGMLRKSAMQYKYAKKQLFLALLKASGIHRQIRFQAADEQEMEDIHRVFGSRVQAQVAPNAPAVVPPSYQPIEKQPGMLRLVYIARIHPVKNLRFLLELLKPFSHSLSLDIYGPAEVAEYWAGCEAAIRQLPPHIEVCHHGELAHERVQEVIAQHHFLVLPSLGESFGHSIFEAFCLGRPVLISDQTAFHNLYPRQLGWDLPLNAPRHWQQALEEAWNMDQQTFEQWAAACRAFASNYSTSSGLVERYLQLFS